jgi:ABC-2 type transport system permease protein
LADLAPILGPAVRPGAFSPLARRQYAAMVWVQSRIFLNSFRTMRGGFELGARVLSIGFFILVSIGPSIGMGFGAYQAALRGRGVGIAILLWVLSAVWQFFSALAPAMAGQNPELSHLLRYPVSFGSWMLLYLVYGIGSPSTMIGFLWTVGIGCGIIAARPDLALTAVLTLSVFLLFNILLSRTILSWIERIMAQRRTREIITAVLLVFALAAQAFNPALHQSRHGLPYGLRQSTIHRIAERAWIVQQYLPPGLATDSIRERLEQKGTGTLPLSGLALCTLAVAGLLAIRLRSESRGENFSETARREVAPSARTRRPPLLDYSGPVGAVFEKDLRYLLRSGPMLYALAVPLVMAFVLGGAFHSGSFSAIRSGYALPLGIVWAFMGLTQLVSNSFGAEGLGMQFYFLAPTPVRTVMLAKNTLHLVLFALEAILITVIVLYRFGPPQPPIATATLAWILFAIPLYLTIGNILSILMPYRVNMTRMRRQEFSLGNGMLSMLSQAAILAIGTAVMVPCAVLGHPWLATPILLALAGVSIAAYLHTLSRIEGMMETHREALIRDIAK